MSLRDVRPLHPLEHHPSYRAAIAAASPIAALASRLPHQTIASTLAVVCGDLALGFCAPVGSAERRRAHHRAWVRIRQIERVVTDAQEQRLAAPEVIDKARRAVDRADVLIGALPGVVATV
jgi:hypothetical protein